MPSGQKIDADDCWEDGNGPCPNGNCLDRNGRKGVVIKETTVACKFFCVHIAHCKTQICCRSADSPQYPNFGLIAGNKIDLAICDPPIQYSYDIDELVH